VETVTKQHSELSDVQSFLTGNVNYSKTSELRHSMQCFEMPEVVCLYNIYYFQHGKTHPNVDGFSPISPSLEILWKLRITLGFTPMRESTLNLKSDLWKFNSLKKGMHGQWWGSVHWLTASDVCIRLSNGKATSSRSALSREATLYFPR